MQGPAKFFNRTLLQFLIRGPGQNEIPDRGETP